MSCLRRFSFLNGGKDVTNCVCKDIVHHFVNNTLSMAMYSSKW